MARSLRREAARPGSSAPVCRTLRHAEQRGALRANTTPWGVLLDHRHAGKLVNVSRTGLAIEVRRPPTFARRTPLKVCWDRDEDLHLEVAVRWCRMIGVERLGDDGDTAPRYLVGLDCEDPRLLELGAPRPALGSRSRPEDDG